MKLISISVVLVFIVVAVGAFAASFWPNPLHGDYHLGGKTLTDPPQDEPQDTHFYLHLEGAAAKTLWEAMRTKPVYDECQDDGSTTKMIGNMQCTESKDKTEYDCYFGIDVQNQKIVAGVTC